MLRKLPYKLYFLVVFLLLVHGVCFSQQDYSGRSTDAASKSHSNKTTKQTIIFVHGFGGSREETWKSEKNIKSWPDMIREDIKCQIEFSHYLSGCRNEGYMVQEFARSLAKDIDQVSRTSDHVYIISHSLGGLVTLAAVEILWKNHRQSYNKVKGIFLCGVPFKGIKESVWFNLAQMMCKSKGMSDLNYQKNKSYLEALNDSWSSIMHVHNEKFPRIFAYNEAEPLYGIPPIANDENIFSHTFDKAIVQGKNHISLVKPSSREERIYRWVKTDIIEIEEYLSREVVANSRLEERNKEVVQEYAARNRDLPPVKIITEEPYGQYRCFDYVTFKILQKTAGKYVLSNSQQKSYPSVTITIDTNAISTKLSIDNRSNDSSVLYKDALDDLKFQKALAYNPRIVLWNLQENKELFTIPRASGAVYAPLYETTCKVAGAFDPLVATNFDPPQVSSFYHISVSL